MGDGNFLKNYTMIEEKMPACSAWRDTKSKSLFNSFRTFSHGHFFMPITLYPPTPQRIVKNLNFSSHVCVCVCVPHRHAHSCKRLSPTDSNSCLCLVPSVRVSVCLGVMRCAGVCVWVCVCVCVCLGVSAWLVLWCTDHCVLCGCVCVCVCVFALVCLCQFSVRCHF